MIMRMIRSHLGVIQMQHLQIDSKFTKLNHDQILRTVLKKINTSSLKSCQPHRKESR